MKEKQQKEENKECKNQTTNSCEVCSKGIVIGYGNCVDETELQKCEYFRTTKIPTESSECLICEDNYEVGIDNKTCQTNTKEEVKYIRNEVEYKCSDGYYLNDEMKCVKCSDNMGVCNYVSKTLQAITCLDNL